MLMSGRFLGLESSGPSLVYFIRGPDGPPFGTPISVRQNQGILQSTHVRVRTLRFGSSVFGLLS